MPDGGGPSLVVACFGGRTTPTVTLLTRSPNIFGGDGDVTRFVPRHPYYPNYRWV